MLPIFIIPKFSIQILTETFAVEVRASKSFTDQLGIARKNGEEYLITAADMESFIPEVYEKIVRLVEITVLNSRQYCVIINPIGNCLFSSLTRIVPRALFWDSPDFGVLTKSF